MSKNRLTPYHARRDFAKTAEPKGKIARKHGESLFVVHEHDARSLHYDLRLEDEGVLKSWAIPKGPSDNPHDKRLAIQTEDHPLEYADFEGVIEEGNYGAGGVLIWDRGTFENVKSQPLSACIKKGIVEVSFDGEKLHGRYALIRTQFSKNSWLFIKLKDEDAHLHNDLLEEDSSVVSDKTVTEIEEEHAALCIKKHT